jgi:hypothetical protein
MGLSERDRRILNEMERDLGTSNPGLFLRISRRHAHLGRTALTVALFLLGVGALVGGAVLAGGFLLAGVLVSVAGFALMLGTGWQLCDQGAWNSVGKRTPPSRRSVRPTMH